MNAKEYRIQRDAANEKLMKIEEALKLREESSLTDAQILALIADTLRAPIAA